MKEKKGISKWLYWFTLGFAIIVVYKCISDFSGLCLFMSRLMKVIMPFFMAIIVAYLFYRPVKFFEKIFGTSKIGRTVSVFLVYAIVVALIALLINCVIPPIKQSVGDLIQDIPEYVEEAKDFIENTGEESVLRQLNIDEIIGNIRSIDITTFLTANRVATYINTVIGIFGTIFNVFVTIIVSIYLLLERGKIKEFLKRLGKAVFNDEMYEKASKYFRKSNNIFLDFIYCQIIDGIIIGILASIAMTVIGVKYSVLLGFFIGLFNIIPYFGAIIAIAVSVLITLFTGGIEQAIIMAITVIILQQIDANIINPKILGDGLKLSPILVIFSVTLGGEFFGVLGMFLSVPIIAIIKLLIVDFVEVRNKLKAYRKGKEEVIQKQ